MFSIHGTPFRVLVQRSEGYVLQTIVPPSIFYVLVFGVFCLALGLLVRAVYRRTGDGTLAEELRVEAAWMRALWPGMLLAVFTILLPFPLVFLHAALYSIGAFLFAAPLFEGRDIVARRYLRPR